MMDENALLGAAMRLRYEAFAKYADEIARATELDKIAEILARHLKFMVNFFALRLTFTYHEESMTFTVHRGRCEFKSNCIDQLAIAERQRSISEVPVLFQQNQIREMALLQGSVFALPQISQLFVLPLRYSAHEYITMLAAHKDETSYNEVDFRFFRLATDMLANKLSQLFLLKTVELRNYELAEINEEITQLNANLEMIVQERTHKLKEANEELQTLFYRTSHDFRRPLSAILGLANLAKMTLQDAMALELFHKCAETVQGMESMLTKLASISAPPDVSVHTSVNFEELLKDIQTQYLSCEPAENITFQTFIKVNKLMFTDAGAIKIILANLVENAVCFRKKEDISFIRIDIKQVSNHLIMTISDNGIGMSDTVQSQIFDMYYRGSELSKGNGLGLYVVKKLIQNLRGSITVDSKEGRGTTFIILLPY